MQDNKIFTLPPMASKYIIRSTGEEVEVIAFNQPENGDRSDDDWVTYIDAQGKEHIKEKLNMQLDFKPYNFNLLEKMLEMPSFQKMPSTKNSRVFEVAKDLVMHGYPARKAASEARDLVEEVGED